MRFWGWCFLLAMFGCPLTASASVVYTYNFPGSPGSGLAVDQASPQPGHGTFGDWSRVNVTALPTAGVFDSTGWTTGSFFNQTVYASFSITADTGYHLNLTQITFDEMRASGGPTKGRVVMFINGSTTAWGTFNYNPTASVQNQVFDFTDTTDADNVTTVEFRFYGWNGGTAGAGLLFDNVATTLNIVPEFDSAAVPIFLVAIVAGHSAFRRRGSARAP